MRAESWVGPVAAIAMLGVTSACGSDVTSTVSVPDATSSDGDQDDGLSFADLDAVIPADVSPPEVPDVGLVDGGGPFPCNTCFCDGRTHYCNTSNGGPPPPPVTFPDDAGPCPDAGSRCTPLPQGCSPARCACLPNESIGCGCYHSDKGDGLLAGCSYP